MQRHANRSPALMMLVLHLAMGSAFADAMAQPTQPAGSSPPSHDLETVEIDGHISFDEKPYRNLLRAMTVFEENRVMAPNAIMRFRVLPWHDEATMRGLTLMLRSKSIRRPITLADDGTFMVEREERAADENARVITNRPPESLAWRVDIRTPGLPPHTRRLGDLRLECKADLSGRGADLATTIKTPGFWAIAAVRDPCTVSTIVWGWFAEEPVFSVTLVSGSRRLTLPSESVYGFHASSMWQHMDWYEHLRDRSYWVPIWDTSWPDDTLVLLEPMRDGAAAREMAAP